MVTKGHASSVKLTRYTFIIPQYFIYIHYKKACYYAGLTQPFSLSARLSPSVLIGLLLPFEATANMQELKEGEGEGQDENEDDPVKKLSFDCQISNLPKLYV